MIRATPIVVLHDLGCPRGGTPWRDALERAEWPGAIIAPDLPGHGAAPAPVGGSYELGDGVLALLPRLRSTDPDLPRPLVVGVGVNGWAAQVIALGGRASAVVLIDGLHGPWRSPAESIRDGKQWLRRIASDDAATAPAPLSGLDPRARHQVPAHGSKRLALKAAMATPVPALLLESPASPLAASEVNEIAAAYRTGATVAHVDAPTAEACVSALVANLPELAPEWSRA